MLQAPKGTRDFYPDEFAIREYIFSSWRKTCKRYAFEPFDAPMFESLELYTKKSGDEIEKQLYTFQDKAGRWLALRPEMTPSLARMVACKGMSLKKPIRWYSIPRLFRYERMQKGRLREFFQLNMDILGIEEVTADAELIAAAIDMMRDLGFGVEDFSIHVSSRSLLEELFISFGIPKEQLSHLYACLDRRHKVTPEEFRYCLRQIVSDKNICSKIEDTLEAKTLSDIKTINPNTGSIETLSQLFEYLTAYNMAEFVLFDIGIVRGLAYYTGIVFEVFDKKRSMRAIAGGGRYDKLVEIYGGCPTPAVGFAAGDVVLTELLHSKGFCCPIPARADIFVAYFDSQHIMQAIEMTCELRKKGISTEYSLKASGIGKQLKHADLARCKLVVFVGGKEYEDGNVMVKNMVSGENVVVPRSQCIEVLSNLLKSVPPRNYFMPHKPPASVKHE